MNWKLILSLSLFGLAMALATVWLVPSTSEPVFWLGIFVVGAAILARRAPDRFFLPGLVTSLVNCVWVTSAHIIFFTDYLANHAQEAAMMQNMPAPDSPRL